MDWFLLILSILIWKKFKSNKKQETTPAASTEVISVPVPEVEELGGN